MTAPQEHGAPEGYVRNETEAAKLDRNFAELLQELRVGQTGVQILFAFLLSLAFQQRFTELSTAQRDLYLATLLAAALAAVLLIAPVSIHRIVFRHHRKAELVIWTSRLAMCGLGCLLLAVLGAVALIVDVVAGLTLAIISTAVIGLVCGTFWYALPLRWRAHRVAETTAADQTADRTADQAGSTGPPA